MPQSGWLKHQKFISTQFWRPEVQNQDGFILRLLFLACRCYPRVVCSRGLCIQVPLLIKTPVMLDEGLAWWPHLSPHTVTFWSTRDEGFNRWIWREHSSVHIAKYPLPQNVLTLPGNSLCPQPIKNLGDKKKKRKNEKEPGRQCGVKSWLYNFDGT